MFFPQSVFLLISIYTILCHLNEVVGYGEYLDRIPNGRNVTHPCFPNALWIGVGHIPDGGGGARNQFGIDFYKAGYKWTRELCQLDSDNDGLTNGQELGDPNCIWTPGSTPFRTTSISHPGVCNPCGSARCNETNKIFGPALYVSPIFDCPAAQGAFKRDYRLSLTQVPSDETTYICQAFEISTNETLYMVANEPVINNTNVLHHMLAYGCTTRPDQARFDAASPCVMGASGCGSLVAIWGYGFKGECLDSNINVKLGLTSFQYIMIQLHWNNPSRLSNYWDNSGFRFHYTSTPRIYSAGMMMIGTIAIELLPGYSSLNITANCSATATQLNWGSKNVPSINVVAAVSHMHTRGRYASIEQYRNNVKVTDIVPYQVTLYSNPPFIQFPAKEVKAGDEMRMVCTYSTVGESSAIYYGEATGDEMCFGFLRYYPQMASDSCTSYGPYVFESPAFQASLISNISGCNITDFGLTATTRYVSKLRQSCSLDVTTCQPACKPIVQLLLQDPCMQGWPRKFMLYMAKFDPNLFNVMSPITLYSNQCEMALRQTAPTTPTNSNSGNTGQSGFSNDRQLALLIAGAVVAFALLLIVCITLLVKAICLSSAEPSNSKSYGVTMNAYDSTAPPKQPVYENGYTIERVF